MHGEIKKINYIRGYFEPNDIVWGVK